MKLKLITISVGGVVFLSLIQLLLAHNLASAGEKVRRLEKRAVQLEEENDKILAEINKIASLAEISKKAQDLGLIRTTQVLHLTSEIPVALK